ncbi:UDP-glucose 4-epimerase GalE [Leptolyngbya sp. BL0902]|nr:UDP-glucose 4-epimerase GalE [Leptolyngbya sp. BL0902]
MTGGAGYIGSHAVYALQQASFPVVILDDLVYGHRDLVDQVLQVPLIEGSTLDQRLLRDIFARYDIGAVMHFAAYTYVGESVTDPGKYYESNVVGTLTLLEAMVEVGVKSLVFSSTCATYGMPETLPITEDHPQQPISPYGQTKRMVEQILTDYDKAHNLRSVRFRYFNAAGAHPSGLLGEDHTPESHLIPLVLQTALGLREKIALYGTDYPTPDGTCIRDYIHVCDLADAHVLGLEYLLKGGSSAAFNLGNGQGFSVREVIDAAQRVTGRQIPVIETERRPGDASILVGSSQKAREILGWNPKYGDIDTILAHAWQWHQQRHGAAVSTL